MDAVWEKNAKDSEGVDTNTTTSQAKKRTKKKMGTSSSKVALVPRYPPPTLIAPKATSAMAHVTKRATPKKQQPLCIVDRLRELSETKDDEDGLVFKKRRVAPPSD